MMPSLVSDSDQYCMDLAEDTRLGRHVTACRRECFLRPLPFLLSHRGTDDVKVRAQKLNRGFVALQTQCDVTLVYDSAIRLLGAAKSGLWSPTSPIISIPAGFYSNSTVDPCVAGSNVPHSRHLIVCAV
jgi:hypothetical protein